MYGPQKSAGDIDTVNRFAAVEEILLIDDCINSDGCFTNLTVADDKLALTAADWNHGVNRLDTRLEWFVYGLAVDNTGSLAFERHFILGSGDRAFAVDWLTERIHNAANEAFTHLDRGDFARALHDRTFADTVGCAHKNGTNVIFFEVQNDSANAIFEFDQLARLSAVQAVNTGDTVAHLQHGANFLQISVCSEAGQLLFQYRGDFFRSDVCHIVVLFKIP